MRTSLSKPPCHKVEGSTTQLYGGGQAHAKTAEQKSLCSCISRNIIDKTTVCRGEITSTMKVLTYSVSIVCKIMTHSKLLNTTQLLYIAFGIFTSVTADVLQLNFRRRFMALRSMEKAAKWRAVHPFLPAWEKIATIIRITICSSTHNSRANFS